MEKLTLADIWVVLKVVVKSFARRVMLRIKNTKYSDDDGLRGGLCSVLKNEMLKLMMMVCAEGYAPY